MNNNSNIELENLEIYKEIVEHMSESLWIWNKENKTIFINDIFCEVTWYTKEEIIWKTYWDFLNKKDILFLKTLNNRNNKIKYESIIKSKEWKKIPVLCSWKLTKNWWIVLIISDLRELNTLKEVKKDLVKLNKTKDEFISIVWHELRTPLTSIRWYLSMILEWDMWELNNQQQKALNHSYNSSVRLIQLVNDVLSIWKIESWKMEYYLWEVIINDLIHSVYEDIYIEMQKIYIFKWRNWI